LYVKPAVVATERPMFQASEIWPSIKASQTTNAVSYLSRNNKELQN